jgi:arsenate reductase
MVSSRCRRVIAEGSAVKTVIYGIPNCDTMKKARTFLESHGIAHEFHNYKIAGIGRAKLVEWAKIVGWEVLLNRKGTTFRKLADALKQDLDEDKALRLMEQQPSLIKRPVLEHGKRVLVGFSADEYADLK